MKIIIKLICFLLSQTIMAPDAISGVIIKCKNGMEYSVNKTIKPTVMGDRLCEQFGGYAGFTLDQEESSTGLKKENMARKNQNQRKKM